MYAIFRIFPLEIGGQMSISTYARREVLVSVHVRTREGGSRMFANLVRRHRMNDPLCKHRLYYSMT